MSRLVRLMSWGDWCDRSGVCRSTIRHAGIGLIILAFGPIIPVLINIVLLGLLLAPATHEQHNHHDNDHGDHDDDTYTSTGNP